jgi:hypothetical protein
MMQLRGVVVAVPESAQRRLEQLDVEVGMALDQMRSLQSRANMVEPGSDLHERLMAARDEQGRRHNHLSRVASSCRQYLFELRLPPGEVLAPVTARASAQPAKGETAAQAIGKLRIEMLVIAQELARARSAPLPIADQIALAEQYISRRAMLATPRIVIQRDVLNLVWADDVVVSKSDLISLLCWLAPKSVLGAVRAGIEAAPAAANAMAAVERDAKVAELSRALLDLERREVALLDSTTLPRPDTSPLAYLMLAIVPAEAAVAAA